MLIYWDGLSKFFGIKILKNLLRYGFKQVRKAEKDKKIEL
jgi:hypothetical protein